MKFNNAVNYFTINYIQYTCRIKKVQLIPIRFAKYTLSSDRWHKHVHDHASEYAYGSYIKWNATRDVVLIKKFNYSMLH